MHHTFELQVLGAVLAAALFAGLVTYRVLLDRRDARAARARDAVVPAPAAGTAGAQHATAPAGARR